METTYCPRCNRIPFSATNRLITEKCGHVKCRECFINDLEGCSECIQGNIHSRLDPLNLTDSLINHELSCNEATLDMESDSHDLCIDTEVDDSTTFEGPQALTPADPGLVATVDNPNSINVIHSYSTSNTQGEASDSTESLKILEEYIIPPKSKIEKFFRETKPISGVHERKKGIPDYVVKIVEDGETSYKCNACGKKFTSRSHQYYHANCGSGGKRFKCKFCSKEFLSSSHLNYHVKSHHESNKYPCSLCPKTFKHSMNLRRHKRTHDGIYKYKCKECGLGFRETKTYTAHMNKHRNIFPFVCKVCGKKFSFKSNLTQHQAIHTGLGKHFRCDECGRDFLRKNSYTEHMNRHKKVKNFQCKLCQTMFIDRKTLERHVNTHGSRYYNCPCCEVKCGRKDNLVRHIRNMHPNEDIAEILKNIQTVVVTNKIVSKSSRSKTQQSKISTHIKNIKDKCKDVKIGKAQKQILASTSVIRSVGNVKPVQIPNDCDLERNLIQLNAIVQESQSENKFAVNNNHIEQRHVDNPPIEVKKPKKKYDPCEIYRKILFANDTDDSVLESEELYSHSKDDHIGCCNVETNTLAKTPMIVAASSANYASEKRIGDHIEPSNFGEIHWRKRTSQNFHTSL